MPFTELDKAFAAFREKFGSKPATGKYSLRVASEWGSSTFTMEFDEILEAL